MRSQLIQKDHETSTFRQVDPQQTSMTLADVIKQQK